MDDPVHIVTVHSVNGTGHTMDSENAKIPKPKFKVAANVSTVLSIEDRYKKKEHREHILLRPDTYIGSVEKEETVTWLYDNSTERMVKSEISYVPGLYKIFDEILVNAIDQYTRMKKYIEIQEQIKNGKAKPTAEVNLSQNFRPVKNIRVTIDLEANRIVVENDGSGIEVALHSKEGVYVPELIFGHLLSGENFEDDEKNLAQDKIWGGRNGYGAKLTNIFSTRFEIETVDEVRKLHYSQVFTNNMHDVGEPVVTRYTKIPYTRVTFYPDLKLFGLTGHIDPGTAGLMIRRVYDTAGWTDQDVSVFLNDTKIPVRSFERYMDLFLGGRNETKRVFYTSDDGRWSVGACVSTDQKFEQVSFVNGIATLRGGKHVDYIVNQITRKMLAQSSTKNSTLKAQHIKDNLWVFVRAVIPDPTFDTQTKESMTLAITKISAKSRCDLSDDFVTRIAKTGVLERAKALNVFRDQVGLNKTDGEKRTRCNVPKLNDAHWAGGPRSEQCTLVITEGDSAKTFADAGISALPAEEQKYWGTFPIRGKLLNVREATVKQIASNAEILALKQILGLQQGRDYSASKSSLRYGRLMILSDADLDGYHIRGLVINFIHFFWPSLLRRNDFLQAMMTPIVRAWKTLSGRGKGSGARKKIDNSTLLNFWTIAEYQQWKTEACVRDDWKDWEIKYYKGLGTSNEQVAKEIFCMKQIVGYTCEGPAIAGPGTVAACAATESVPALISAQAEIKTVCKQTPTGPAIAGPRTISAQAATESGTVPVPAIAGTGPISAQAEISKNIDDLIVELAFDSSRADDRKNWLAEYQEVMVPFKPQQTIREFVNEELRQFSREDCIRSIPSICDGLKPGQRKILFLVLNDNINKEIRVAQLAGYVSAKTGYHHGEASLIGAIVKMAQNYPGSNNINLLYPEGQFGTRRQNGKDSASPRYINTFKTPIVDNLFVRDDNQLYEFLDDDGMSVEPRWYLPIIPTILVNGALGIGTGYSTNIPTYNPLDIVANIRRMLSGAPAVPMAPWIHGFKGAIVPHPDPKKIGSFLERGTWKKIGEDEIEITEIPTNWSYESYHEFLDSLLDDSDSKKRKSTESSASARETPIKRRERIVRETIKSVDTSFRPFRPIIKFTKGGLDRLETDVGVSVALKLESAINTSNMYLFNSSGVIQKYSSPEAILVDYFPLRLEYYAKRRQHILDKYLTELPWISARLRFVLEVMDGQLIVHRQKREAIVAQLAARGYPEKNLDCVSIGNTERAPSNFTYLLHMHIESFTEETIRKLEREKTDLEDRIKWLESQSPEVLWSIDLDSFEKAYVEFEADWLDAYRNTDDSARIPQPKLKKKAIKVI